MHCENMRMSVGRVSQLFFPWFLRENGSKIHLRDKPFQNSVMSLYAVGTPCGRLETTRLIDNRKKSTIDMKTSNMRHRVHLSIIEQ
jgi:hypothetical protein